jgi:hyperosmotically inducible protein
MTLALCACVALAACSKESGNNAEVKPTVGEKIGRAVERTQEKLSAAGERAKEEVADAAEKTQQTLSQAGDRMAGAAQSPPYAPRQPAQGSAATTPTPPAAASAGSGAPGNGITLTVPSATDTTPTTTTTLTTGPTTSVKTSAISVSPETRARIDDAVITASVKAGIVKDPDLSVLKIDVDTRDGVVTLNGLAGNEPAKARAEKLAQSVKGVREVRNHLAVKQG